MSYRNLTSIQFPFCRFPSRVRYHARKSIAHSFLVILTAALTNTAWGDLNWVDQAGGMIRLNKMIKDAQQNHAIKRPQEPINEAPSQSYAHPNGGNAPVGGWKVRHGYVRTAYWFEDDGSYTYERSGPERQDEETGSYIVQGERLILSPDGKPQRTMQWWIGTEATALEGESILWLVDQYGRKEMFYPQR